MIESEKIKKIPYGGDYNPEQYSEDVWAEDMRLLKAAHVDILTLNVFSWASLQPAENTYCFDKLDKIMKLVKENGFQVCLATSTAAHPAWMAKRCPEILRTEFSGIRRKFGGRHNSCPNSRIFRHYSEQLASKLAKRYQNYDNIVAWHISNEYGGECYCENCEKAFRVWLHNKYHTLEELNRVWNTSFWGHTFYNWDEIVVPNMQSEHFAENRTMFQGISLDYRRFQSESMLNCYLLEYKAIKQVTPTIPITTNFMGLYKPLDYQRWAPYLDFISWDNYPSVGDTHTITSLKHDAMRGLKLGKPFALMEQTPSISNWHPYCALKRPGVLRLWSYQAIAHGADTVMYFQMRRSIGACEKYHSAVIDHAGHENTRVFREVTALGAELDTLGDTLLGGRTYAKAAILFDWDNWWSTEYSAGPSTDLHYIDEIHKYYRAFNELHIPVDVIGMNADLSAYQLVVAPVLYMVKGNYDEVIRRFTANGGIFVTTFFSGYVDENDLVTVGGYPGKLRDILGIWVEEIDALPPDTENHFTYQGVTYPATLLCDLLHTEHAESLSTYEEDFYSGMPVITRNSFGKGSAYYIAASSNEDFYYSFLQNLCKEASIPALAEAPKDVEVTVRSNKHGTFLFVLNHTKESQTVTVWESSTDLLTQMTFTAGEAIPLAPVAVRILCLNQSSEQK